MKTLCKIMVILIATFAVTTVVYGDQPGLVRGFFSGAQEVTDPPAGVDSDTRGRIELTFTRSLSTADFRIVVNNGIAVTAAHLHCGRAGENGPIVVTLYDNPAGTDISGELAAGPIFNGDIDSTAACDTREAIGRPINNIASLFMAIRAGAVYANVHTVANPDGEVRAQLFVEENDIGGTTASTAASR